MHNTQQQAELALVVLCWTAFRFFCLRKDLWYGPITISISFILLLLSSTLSIMNETNLFFHRHMVMLFSADRWA
jgi:hypothetical protein